MNLGAHPSYYVGDSEAEEWQGVEADFTAGSMRRALNTRRLLLEAIEKPCEGEEKASDRLIELRSLAKRIRG